MVHHNCFLYHIPRFRSCVVLEIMRNLPLFAIAGAVYSMTPNSVPMQELTRYGIEGPRVQVLCTSAFRCEKDSRHVESKQNYISNTLSSFSTDSDDACQNKCVVTLDLAIMPASHKFRPQTIIGRLSR